jgi:hypothetical protein
MRVVDGIESHTHDHRFERFSGACVVACATPSMRPPSANSRNASIAGGVLGTDLVERHDGLRRGCPCEGRIPHLGYRPLPVPDVASRHTAAPERSAAARERETTPHEAWRT